jgi:hypothetical protein
MIFAGVPSRFRNGLVRVMPKTVITVAMVSVSVKVVLDAFPSPPASFAPKS